eukprot:CAMPEP_0181243612 /NCGR_PEP_ID=MMETSP1096-20121128/42372_1 /TAXON_ID=156174 ORGANISM="Chrysochromulina ericina, Strain CCMP281" /NCGR_SAMPLE_ID=MMETSP1096 /ASSEMBLY_ACC=CAM_ASM_000453 /LENGTH=122 /DNA_ID=CAMNT_0023340011 /DNA_START=187 /DNA_END=556 /DNA_ORIENTATION=-
MGDTYLVNNLDRWRPPHLADATAPLAHFRAGSHPLPHNRLLLLKEVPVQCLDSLGAILIRYNQGDVDLRSSLRQHLHLDATLFHHRKHLRDDRRGALDVGDQGDDSVAFRGFHLRNLREIVH